MTYFATKHTLEFDSLLAFDLRIILAIELPIRLFFRANGRLLSVFSRAEFVASDLPATPD